MKDYSNLSDPNICINFPFTAGVSEKCLLMGWRMIEHQSFEVHEPKKHLRNFINKIFLSFNKSFSDQDVLQNFPVFSRLVAINFPQ